MSKQCIQISKIRSLRLVFKLFIEAQGVLQKAHEDTAQLIFTQWTQAYNQHQIKKQNMTPPEILQGLSSKDSL